MNHKALNIFFILILLALSGCSTTKVTNVKYVKGELLKTETSEPILLETVPEIAIGVQQIKLTNKEVFQTKTIKIYEKVQSSQLNTRGTEMTDSPFWAIIGTPGALILDVMTLGTMGATAEIWTEDKNSWKTLKTKLENDFIVDESNKNSYRKQPISGQQVSLFLNDKFVSTYTSNAQGIIEYDFANVLLRSGAAPKNLINNQGVTLTVSINDKSKKQKISNKNIPESFFTSQFVNMKADLMQRKGRFENCEFIAANKREFFECYYQ